MSIGININKAKEIHKDYIRSVRNQLLQEKDVEYMKVLETGDTEKVAVVIAEKQALRDATKIVDNTNISESSVEEVTKSLKMVWDQTLLGPNILL
jgi:hypothetical protein